MSLHMSVQKQQQHPQEFPPLLIKAGLVFSESIPLSELFCKPKLLPIRGTALERLQELDEKIIEQRRLTDEDKLAASKFGSKDPLGKSFNENSGGSHKPLVSAGGNNVAAGPTDVPLIAETFVDKIEDFSQFR